MFTYDCVLAAVLLTAAPDLACPIDTGSLELLRPALMQLALDAEVVDSREEPLRYGQSQDVAGDLRVLQTRWQDLLLTPHLEECQRFPKRAIINELLSFNRAYRADLLTRMDLDPLHAEELRSALQETDQLYRLWNLLRDARCEFYYVAVRRQSLRQFRDLVGRDAFDRGQLPPHVPYWHFSVLR
jgi:hypothetical protein